MSRIGKFLAVGWTCLCVTLAMAFLGTVGGCSDSTGTIEQAKRDEAVEPGRARQDEGLHVEEGRSSPEEIILRETRGLFDLRPARQRRLDRGSESRRSIDEPLGSNGAECGCTPFRCFFRPSLLLFFFPSSESRP